MAIKRIPVNGWLSRRYLLCVLTKMNREKAEFQTTCQKMQPLKIDIVISSIIYNLHCDQVCSFFSSWTPPGSLHSYFIHNTIKFYRPTLRGNSDMLIYCAGQVCFHASFRRAFSNRIEILSEFNAKYTTAHEDFYYPCDIAHT